MFLNPIKKSKKTERQILESFFVFDIETTKLEPLPKNFVFGVIYGYNFKKVIYSVKDFKKEFKDKRYNNKTIFAHNAEFDLNGIFGNIIQNIDSKAIFNGKFIMAKHRKITFADSMNVLLGSVEKLGKRFNLPKLEVNKIKEGKLTKLNMSKLDIDYCTRDCEIVYKALSIIFLDIMAVKITISSISLYDYRKNYLKKPLKFNDLVYDFYESYFGGRTEAFKIGIVKANVFDINSLYPYIMKKEFFPNVSSLKRVNNITVREFKEILKNNEGMAKVTVNHRDSYIGSLPFKFDGKLLFPVGVFTTTVNFNELRFSNENGFIDILKVHHVVYSQPVKSPFYEFIDYHYEKRKTEKDELRKYYYKIKMNALYGRWGMRKKYITEYYPLIPYEYIKELEENNKPYKLNIFSSIREDCFLETENKRMENSFFAIPTYASYIASGARVEILKGLLNNKEGLVYCDTDSIFTESKFSGVENLELGNYKNENKSVIEIRGLKNYSYIEDGNICEVIKGISKRAKKIDNVYYTEKYFKTKQAIRNSKISGENYIEKKRLTHVYNKRTVLKNGKNTKPIKF